MAQESVTKCSCIALVAVALAFGVGVTFPRAAGAVCGDGVIDGGEDCDDGMACTGGSSIGESCTMIADCGDGAVDGDCRPVGGDDCASNCTTETVRELTLDPVESRAFLRGQVIGLPVALSGTQSWRTGSADADGKMPVAIRVEDVHYDPVMVPGIMCVCPRGTEALEFGSGNASEGEIACGSAEITPGVDYVSTEDHNVGEVGKCSGGANDGQDCTADGDCPDGICFEEQDCLDGGGTVEEAADKHPGVCNGVRTVEFSNPATDGAALLNATLALGTISDTGTCATETDTKICSGGDNAGNNCDEGCPGGECVPAKGPDGIPCTDDDPPEARGSTQVIPNTTGVAAGRVLNANNEPGKSIEDGSDFCFGGCVASETGVAIDCNALAASDTGGLDGTALAAAFPALDIDVLSDFVASIKFVFTQETVAACVGDCDGNGEVTVSELITGVNISLERAQLDTCPVFDGNDSGAVEINELIGAVNNALNGCS